MVIKVEDVTRIRTKSTRNDKWLDEGHDIDVDKANEIEITVYDKPGEHPLPVGMLWIRISDLVEELRRKRIEQDISSSGWVSADKMANSAQQGRASDGQNYAGIIPPSALGASGSPGMYMGNSGRVVAQQGPQSQNNSSNVDAWFSLEPVGQIHLSLNFGKPLCPPLGAPALRHYSKVQSRKETAGPWCTREKRCCSSKEGRSPRDVWPQVRAATVLQHHAVRTLRRTSQVFRWHAML